MESRAPGQRLRRNGAARGWELADWQCAIGYAHTAEVGSADSGSSGRQREAQSVLYIQGPWCGRGPAPSSLLGFVTWWARFFLAGYGGLGTVDSSA